MTAIHFDPPFDDAERRRRLYDGALLVFSPNEATRSLCAFADTLIREAFGSRDPERAQYDMQVEAYAELLKELKPRFIHHPESKRLVREVLESHGCDPDDIHFDVPRLRTSTSDGYLTTGIAYAWHPHRDTWYSAPPAQLNWWLPIYPIAAENTVAFYPAYFRRALANDSAGYDYAEWNAKYRFTAADQLKKDTRPLPGPLEEIPDDARLPLVCEPAGLILFSGAQLHASVPNHTGRTRFSIDFRTVSLEDCRRGIGAPTQDVQCTSTSVRDFKRASDLAEMPEEVVAALDIPRR